MTNLTAHGYAGIDDSSKVRHLLKGIKSCKLDAVKTAILASSNLRSDFSGCVTLYKDYMTQMRGVSQGEQRQIAGFEVEGEEEVPGGGGSGKGGKGKKRPWENITVGKKCDDRYYSAEEYRALSREERFYLRALRDKRVASGGRRNNPRRAKGGGGKRMKAADKAISVLSTAVDALQMGAAINTSTIAPVATTLAVIPPVVAAVAVNNTNNTALSRIATRQTRE